MRRYLQKTDESAGVIISKIETGSKAAVAGIKPFELITEINGKPLKSVEAFAKLVADKDELQLSIERMNKSRQVRIRLNDNKEEDAVEDVETDEPGE